MSLTINDIPNEILFIIGLYLPLSDLLTLCQTNSKFNNLLCGSDLYWKSRYIQDFSPVQNITNWKQEYYNIGDVWVCGSNWTGQLGLRDPTEMDKHTVLNKIPDIKAKFVDCGNYHTVVVDLQNYVWVCGNNGHGQLGIGDPTETTKKAAMTKIPNFKAKTIA